MPCPKGFISNDDNNLSPGAKGEKIRSSTSWKKRKLFLHWTRKRFNKYMAYTGTHWETGVKSYIVFSVIIALDMTP